MPGLLDCETGSGANRFPNVRREEKQREDRRDQGLVNLHRLPSYREATLS